jgi:hypothetical protein
VQSAADAAHHINTRGIIMTTRLLRATGMKVDIKYPDYDMIIDGIKRGKTA